MPSISIIVPIYNTKKKYLKKCVESLINQTFKDIEIILVNDGSTEKHVETICNQYKENDKRISVINQKNQGVSMARNNAMMKANSDWVMFVDSDDWIEENTCEKMYNAIENDVDIIISKNYMVRGENYTERATKLNIDTIFIGEEKQKIVRGIFYDYGNYASYVDTPWAKLYKLSIIKNNEMKFDKDLKSGEDGLFNFEFYHYSKKIKFLNEYTYYYRINESSVTNSFRKDIVQNYLRLCKEYEYLFEKIDEEKVGRKYLSYFTIRKIDDYSKKYFFNSENKKNKKEIKEEFWNLIDNEYFKYAIKNIDVSELSKKRKYVLKACKDRNYLKIKVLYTINRIKNKLENIA